DRGPRHLAPGDDDGGLAVPVAQPVAVGDEVLGELGLDAVGGQARPALRPVGAGGVEVGERLVGPHGLGLLQHALRVEAQRRVEQHQPLHALGRGAGEVHGDRAAERVTDDRGAVEAEPVEHAEHVRDVLLDPPRRVPRGAAVAAQVDRVHAHAGQRLGEHPVAGAVAGDAVHREHRAPVRRTEGMSVEVELGQVGAPASGHRHDRGAGAGRWGVGPAWLHRAVLRSDARPDRAALAPGLVRRQRPAATEPEWDDAARRVLEHTAGPLRVIGGPGTGKTTVLLTSVARRIRAGDDPSRTLVLVGSRRAAAELRERIVELAHDPAGPRTTREPLVRTVHSYAFGVLRLHAARNGDPPPRLLASAEQDAVVRDLLGGELAGPEGGGVPDSGWGDRLRPALGLPGFAAELRELLLRAVERGLGPDELAELGRRHDVPEWVAAGRFFRTYEHVIQLR